jgi:hypothetical protein
MKNSFLDLVRKGKTKHPTQISFDLQKWEDFYNETEDLSASSKKLYIAGKWTFSRLEKIREKLKENNLDNLSGETALKLYVANINRITKIISDVRFKPAEGEGVFAPQLIELKVDNNVIGVPQTPDNVLDTVVDGAKHPIKRYTNSKITTDGNISNDLDVLSDLTISSLLGQYYDIVERFWLRFLWLEWEVIEKENFFLVIPTNIENALVKAISDYRKGNLEFERIFRLFEEWKEFPETLKRQLSVRPIVFKDVNGEYYFKIISKDTKLPSNNLMRRAIAAEQYYEGVFEEKIASLGNISIEELLNFWDLLYELASTQLIEIPQTTGADTLEKFIQFSPTIERANLKTLFSNLVDCLPSTLDLVIDFFTFNSPLDKKKEIWDAPLIHLGNGKYALVFAAPKYHTPVRVLERFLVRGELDLTKKGYLFEKESRVFIQEATDKNEIFKNALVFPQSFQMSIDKETEEIDLILKIGKTILIGEAKCIIYPHETLELFRYFSILEDAADQIKRKLSFVNTNKEKFLESLKFNGDFNGVEIQPFVFINTTLGTGFTIKDVPVVDKYILNLYLAEGEILQKISSDFKIISENEGSIRRFYNTEEEAESNIFSYLCHPPQISIYTKFMKAANYPAPKISQDDKPYILVVPEINMPLPRLEKYSIEPDSDS